LCSGALLSLIQLPSAASAHGLCCVLRFRSSSFFSSSFSSFFSFLFPFLPFLGFLLLWLSMFSVVSFLFPFPGIAWCLAFPCIWFGRPLLTSFSCCFCFVLNCVGFLAVVVVVAVVAVVVVVVGVMGGGGGGGGGCLFAFGIWPALVRWRGGGWCLFVFGFGGIDLFVGVVDGWCLFAFGFCMVFVWWCLLAFGVRPAFVRWRGG